MPISGQRLASEYLAERHGNKLSHETLRQIMIGAGLWQAQAAERVSLLQSRYCGAHRGERIQADGSNHDWLEAVGRAPAC